MHSSPAGSCMCSSRSRSPTLQAFPRGIEEPFTMYSVLFDLTGWHTDRAQPGRVSRKGRAWIVERSRS